MQGAARLLEWADIARFQELPMLVKFRDEQAKEHEKILQVDSVDDEGRIVVWKLANISANFGARRLAIWCR